jgi:hypothetical protein
MESIDNTDAAPSNPTPSPPAPSAAAADADPEEVDISQHFYTPSKTNRIPQETQQPSIGDEQLRQMMLGFERSNTNASPNPMAGMPPGTEEDPIMKMMAQMMGGGGGPGGAGGFPGMPGMGGMPNMPGMPGMGQQQPVVPDPYTSLWRLLHALVALGLGLYIAILTPFTGTKLSRERSVEAHLSGADDEDMHRKNLFFWVFATAEAVLLTTRFFLDKSRAPPTGMVWTVVGFLPEPLKGYATTLLRYGQIFGTVRSDILACMFVLGVCHWWRA